MQYTNTNKVESNFYTIQWYYFSHILLVLDVTAFQPTWPVPWPVNGTAIGDIDFENKTEEVFIAINETVKVYFNVLADDDEELEEEFFAIRLESYGAGWDVHLTINSTATVYIAADNETRCKCWRKYKSSFVYYLILSCLCL